MPEGRVIECQETNRDYPNMFARYTDINSAAIHKNQILGDGIAGYVVDILVLDPIPDEEAHKEYINDLMLYSDLINMSLNYSYRYQTNKKRFNQYYKRMLKEGKEKVLSELEKKMFSYKEEECAFYTLRWGGVPFLFKKEMYGSSRWGMFEGISCRIPDRSGDYLTQHYGDDWMYIPPHNEHESHDAIFSFTTDYKTIQKDYLRYIDVPKVRKSYIKRKKFFLKHMEERFAEMDEEVAICCIATKMELEKRIKEKEVDLKECLEKCEYHILNDVFKTYFSKQFNRKYIGREDYSGINRFNNPGYVDIDDNVLYIAVMLLINTNRIAKAKRLLDIRKSVKGELTSELKQAESMIVEIRDAISDYDVKNYSEAFEKTVSLYNKYPGNESLNMFYVRQLLERGEKEQAKTIIDSAKLIFPENGVFYKYEADCILDKDTEAAYQLYEKAIEKTTNGYTLMEIEQVVLADKDCLIKEIIQNSDYEKAVLISRLAPNDIDIEKVRLEVLIDITEDKNEIYNLIDEVKCSIDRFDKDSRLLETIMKIYVKLGESMQVAEIRKKILLADNMVEYNKIKDELTERASIDNSSEVYKLLGDINLCIGLSDQTIEMYKKAKMLNGSWLSKKELENFVQEEI